MVKESGQDHVPTSDILINLLKSMKAKTHSRGLFRKCVKNSSLFQSLLKVLF